MKPTLTFDLPSGYRVETCIRFSDGFRSIPSVCDSGHHVFGLPRSGDTIIIKISKL